MELSVSGLPDSDSVLVLQEYCTRGEKLLQQTDYPRKFVNVVHSVHEKNKEAFFFVCNSSGTGKTQLMFSLPADEVVVYIPLAISQRPQPIYQLFEIGRAHV